ncbi:hypothetical protein C8F01DRAFT_1057607 [Mycena amicta]|nr:hypothetical protein C8F01DRAFT_1057607 [Mycena amicta]
MLHHPPRPTSITLVVLLAAATVSASAILSVSPSQWNALNASVGGRLHSARPFSLPCFSSYNNVSIAADPQACSAIQANYTSPLFRQVEYETCMATASSCLLDPTNPTNIAATNGVSCSQGEIPPFYIDIRTASDVQSAFEFSKKTKVPLSIKNTGHDYIGRSRRRDSLGLWTHNLQSMTYQPSFVPGGCSNKPANRHRAITVGAGVIFDQVYQFADANNATFIGGYAQTVGVSGGWMMGGGHSVLSPAFGLGVDRVLEIKIVTPDSQFRTASACENEDLFWALRGGGGGTFGVVLESTHLVEQRFPIQVINMTFTPSSTNLQEYFEILVNNSAMWGEQAWGGHINRAPAGILYVNPRLSLAQAQKSMSQLVAFANATGGTATIQTLPSWLAFYQQIVVKVQAAVGSSTALGSRLIPKALFESPDGRQRIVQHLLSQTAVLGMPYVPIGPPAAFNYTLGATSVSPAWRTSLWHLAAGINWPYNSTPDQTRVFLEAVHEFVANLTELAPVSGAYINEGDVYQSDHEFTYWGDNYPRLLSIKRKYDPDTLLNCWRCVGWTGPKDFPCYITLD